MKSKLIHKLIAFVLPLTITSVVVTSIALSLTSYRDFRKNIAENYCHILENAAGQVSLFLDCAQTDLETLAQVLAALNLDNWQTQMAITSFMQYHPGFLSMSVAGLDGQLIARCGVAENSEPELSAIFEKARSGQAVVSKVWCNSSNLPFVYMATPVQQRGRTSFVLYGLLNLKAIWNILMDIQIGSTGRIAVLDAEGITIGHPQITEVISKQRIKNPDILEKLAATDTVIEWIETSNHGSSLFFGIRLANPDWVILLSQNISETYTHLYRHIAWAAVLTLIMSLIAGFFSWRNSRRFLDPIRALHLQVKNISQGDFRSKVSLTTDDEIADLARAFNEMIDSIQKYIMKEVEHAKQLVHAKNLAELGTTASKVTHEVGNLLNNIGLAVLSLKTEPLGPKGQKAVEMLKKDSERIRKFIEDFLRFAKKPELNPILMPLKPLIQEVLTAHEPRAQLTNVRFELDWPDGISPLKVDAHRIYQVFFNLIKNSLQAMEASGGMIRVSAKPEQEHLQILLEDTGPGIDAKIAGQIFQPFFTTKGKQGTGLGLAIVKGIIEAHRGTVSYQNHPDGGAQFIVRLPLN